MELMQIRDVIDSLYSDSEVENSDALSELIIMAASRLINAGSDNCEVSTDFCTIELIITKK